jgi:hypothetical protein
VLVEVEVEIDDDVEVEVDEADKVLRVDGNIVVTNMDVGGRVAWVV